jgi:hypothetical protein
MFRLSYLSIRTNVIRFDGLFAVIRLDLHGRVDNMFFVDAVLYSSADSLHIGVEDTIARLDDALRCGYRPYCGIYGDDKKTTG